MINGQKSEANMNTEMPERKPAAAKVVKMRGSVGRKMEVAQVVIRLACLFSSVVALSIMAKAKQSSTISVYGLDIPLISKWSFYDSFLYLVGVSAAVALHSMLHLFICASRFIGKIPRIPSRNQVWLFFAGDQICALAMLGVGSSALGLHNVNRAGVQHLPFPDVCNTLHAFCNHVTVSIALTFFGFFLLAISVVFDVVWLC